MGTDEVPNLVVKEHMEFIKDTLTDKHNALLEGGINAGQRG